MALVGYIRKINKKILVIGGIGIFFAAGTAAVPPGPDEPGGKNLKVIPKKIDGDQIERLMHKMSHDIGAMCSKCHPYTKPGITPMRVDFISDELPDKIIARKMMVMTDKLNKKYFGFKNNYSQDAMNTRSVITCNTCHRGSLKPNNDYIIPKSY